MELFFNTLIERVIFRDLFPLSIVLWHFPMLKENEILRNDLFDLRHERK